MTPTLPLTINDNGPGKSASLKKIDLFNYFGLSKREQQILGAAYTAASISSISRKTKIPRTSLLYVLKRLEKRKITEKIVHGKRILWKTRVRTGGAVRAIEESEEKMVRVYRGIPEILQIYEEFIALPKGSRWLCIQPNKSLRLPLRKVPPKHWERINTAIKEKGFITEGIVHASSPDTFIQEIGPSKAHRIFGSFIGRLEDYTEIPPNFDTVASEIYFFKKTAYLIDWDAEIAVAIHNRPMVSLLYQMFVSVKSQGMRLHQNAKMEIYRRSIQKRSGAK